MAPRNRNLTDADVEAMSARVADIIEKRIEERFYTNIGRGVWAAAWRIILAALLVIAAYGAVKGAPFAVNWASRTRGGGG